MACVVGDIRFETGVGNPIHRRDMFITSAPLPELDCCEYSRSSAIKSRPQRKGGTGLLRAAPCKNREDVDKY